MQVQANPNRQPLTREGTRLRISALVDDSEIESSGAECDAFWMASFVPPTRFSFNPSNHDAREQVTSTHDGSPSRSNASRFTVVNHTGGNEKDRKYLADFLNKCSKKGTKSSSPDQGSKQQTENPYMQLSTDAQAALFASIQTNAKLTLKVLKHIKKHIKELENMSQDDATLIDPHDGDTPKNHGKYDPTLRTLENETLKSWSKYLNSLTNSSESTTTLDNSIQQFARLAPPTHLVTLEDNLVNSEDLEGYTHSSALKAFANLPRNRHVVKLKDSDGNILLEVVRTANIGAPGIKQRFMMPKGIMNTLFGLGSTHPKGVENALSIIQSELAELAGNRKLYLFDITGTISQDDEWQMAKNIQQAIKSLAPKDRERVTLIRSNVRAGKDIMKWRPAYSDTLIADAKQAIKSEKYTNKENITKALTLTLQAIATYQKSGNENDKMLIMAAQINLVHAMGGRPITMCKSGKDRNSVLNWIAMAMAIYLDRQTPVANKDQEQVPPEPFPFEGIANIMNEPKLLESVLQTTRSVARGMWGFKAPDTVTPTRLYSALSENIKQMLNDGAQTAKSSTPTKPTRTDNNKILYTLNNMLPFFKILLAILLVTILLPICILLAAVAFTIVLPIRRIYVACLRSPSCAPLLPSPQIIHPKKVAELLTTSPITESSRTASENDHSSSNTPPGSLSPVSA